MTRLGFEASDALQILTKGLLGHVSCHGCRSRDVINVLAGVVVPL